MFNPKCGASFDRIDLEHEPLQPSFIRTRQVVAQIFSVQPSIPQDRGRKLAALCMYVQALLHWDYTSS